MTLAVTVFACSPGGDADPGESSSDETVPPQIVFVSDRGGSGMDVYTHVLGTEEYTRLTSDSATDYGPIWSPDGSRILFDSDLEGATDVFAVARDGTARVRLTTFEGYDGGGDWSPDGSAVVFTSTREAVAEAHAGRDIWVMDADGSNPRRLTTNDMYEGAPRYSPDGSRIAFCRQLPPETEGGESNGEIFVMDRDGANAVRITDQPTFDCLADWSPNGESLAFHGCDAEGCRLFIAPAAGGAARHLETPHPANWPMWSPDGEWIAYTATVDGQTDIWLVRPDGSEHRAVTTHPARDEVADWLPRGR